MDTANQLGTPPMKGIRQTQTAIINRASPRDGGYVRLRINRIVFVTAYKQQSGQVLALTVIMMLVLGIATFMLFNTGQLVTRKTKLTNAADAAAYSAAVEEARVMNFMAYTNRARIANQVAIAQAVSLVSWMNYARKVANNIKKVLRYAKYVAGLAGPEGLTIAEIVSKVATTVARAVAKADKLVTSTANVEIRSLDKVTGILSKSQDLVIGLLLKKSKGAIGQFELHSIVSTVVYDNDRDASVTYVSSGVSARPFYQWVKEYFHHYKLGPDHNRYKNVIMEARDGFTRNRHENELGGTLKVRGGADLLKYNTWAAVDTLSFHIPIPIIGKEVPIGWGSAQTGKKRSYLKGESHGRGWKSPYDRKRQRPYGGSRRANKRATKRAQKNSTRLAGRSKGRSGYRGLRQYYDIADVEPKNFTKKSKDYCDMSSSLTGPCITVEAEIEKDQVRTTETIEGGDKKDTMVDSQAKQKNAKAGESMKLKDAEAGGVMTAIASAQVYFYRPYDSENFHRHDKFQKDSENYIEYGSLFSPYWQARLVPTPRLARAALVAAQGASLP
jgi:Flp pilus assembly protein TadG